MGGRRGGQVLKAPRKRAQKHIHTHTHVHTQKRRGAFTRSADRSISSRLRAGESLAMALWVFTALKMEDSPTTIDREAQSGGGELTQTLLHRRLRQPPAHPPGPEYTLPENPAAGGASDRGRRRCARRSRFYMLFGGGALRSIRRFMPRRSDSPPSPLAEEPSQPGCAEDGPGVRGM